MSVSELLRLAILREDCSCRGDFIVPNFEEIWPSGKSKNKKGPSGPETGIDYILHASSVGIPGQRNLNFSTVGKPKVR